MGISQINKERTKMHEVEAAIDPDADGLVGVAALELLDAVQTAVERGLVLENKLVGNNRENSTNNRCDSTNDNIARSAYNITDMYDEILLL
jgi:hypothetical protein